MLSFILLFSSLGLHHHLPLCALLAALLLARPPLLADLDEPLREAVAAELAELARLQDVEHVRGQLRAHLQGSKAERHCKLVHWTLTMVFKKRALSFVNLCAFSFET